MADKKISQLSAASTPLAGTEVLPIVQSSATVKVATNDLTVRNIRANATTGILQVTGPAAASTRVVTVPDANFTAARTDAAQSFTGDQTLSTGNLVIGTAGKGIDFTATSSGSGTMTSELFADYEEGTWTPTLIGSTTNPAVTYTLQRGIYTKVGRNVTVSVFLGWSAFSGGSGNVAFGNLPFTIENAVGPSFAGSIALFDGFTLSAARTSVGLLGAGGTTYSLPSCFGSAVSSAYITVGSVAASGVLQYSLTYSV